MLRILYAGIELTDGLLQGSLAVKALVVNGARAVDVVENIRAVEPLFFDRLMIKNMVNLEVTKQVDGEARALYLALMRRQTLPGRGALVIEATIGATVHRWTAARAACAATQSSALGASVDVIYGLMTGVFGYSSSAADLWVGETIGGRDLSGPGTGRSRGGRHLVHTGPAYVGGRDLGA